MKLNVLLLIVIIFSLAIRLFHLTDQPEGFYQNEASFGYNAYSLLKTGKDEYGRFLPLILESFGDYKLAGFSYWLLPFITVLGLTEYGVRFSVVIAGVIILYLTYAIVNEIFRKKKIALLSSFILAISPWHLVFSRTANETIVAVMFYYLSLFFYLVWLRKNTGLHFILGSLGLIAAVLTYYSTWLPAIYAISGVLLVIYKRIFKAKKYMWYILVLCIPMMLMVLLTSSSKGQRLQQINLFSHSGSQALLDEQIREDQHQLSPHVLRVLHNKVIFYPNVLLSNFFSTFNFDFLFIRGDAREKVYLIPYSGVLYIWMAPLILLGALHVFKNYSLTINGLLWGLVFVTFLANGMSVFGSESQRTLIAAPVIILFISFGLVLIWSYSKRILIRPLLLIGGLIIMYQISYFTHQYFWHANVHQPWFRNYGAKEMVQTVARLAPEYKQVAVSGNPYIFFYFYNKTDPVIAQNESKELRDEKDALNHRVRKKMNTYLNMPLDCPAGGKEKILYVCRGTRIPSHSKVLSLIPFRDSQPAYIFLEFVDHESKTSEYPNVNFMEYSLVMEEGQQGTWKDIDEVKKIVGKNHESL